MTVNLGSATGYLDLNTKGFSKGMQDAKREATTTSQKIGSGFGSLSTKFSEVGGSLTKYITTPIIGAATALGSLSAWGGFKRLTEIDTAQQKLLALGYTADEVAGVMDSVDYAVTDTAYTLNDGMTIAVSAMASGVKGGEELSDYLKMTADTASLAGIEYNEMGSIMNKVQAKGKADTEIMNQLAERGVPIIAWLGETYNKTAAEIMDMTSDGAISSEMFFNSVMDHTEGMSVAMGQTVPGKMANVRSAISRIGAAFLGAGEEGSSSFDTFKDVLDRVLEGFRSLIPVAAEVGKVFADWLNKMIDKIEEVIDWWKQLSSEQKSMIIQIAGFVVALGPLLKILGSVFGVFEKVSKIITPLSAILGKAKVAFLAISAPVQIIIGIVGILVAAFATLMATNEEFRDTIGGIWNRITGIFSDFFSKISDRLESLRVIFETVVDFLWNAWLDFANFLAPIFEGAFNQIATTFQFISDLIIGLLDIFIGAFNGDWDKVWEGAKTIFEGAWTFIKDTLSNLLTTMWNLIKNIPSTIGSLFVKILTLLKDVAISLLGIAITIGKNILSGIIDWVKQLPGKIAEFFSNIWSRLVTWSTNLWNKAKETGSNFFSGIIDWFKQLPGKISEFITNVFSRISTWGTNLWNKAKETGANFVNNIVNFFKELPGKVMTWLTNVVSNIISWGSNIATRARTAASSFVTNAINVIKGLPSQFMSWLTNAANKVVSWGSNLASKGRTAISTLISSVKNAALNIGNQVVQIGRDIVNGVWRGIKNAAASFTSNVRGFFGGIVGNVKSFLGIGSPSKVFADEVGQWMPAGAAMGFEEAMPEAVKDMQTSLDEGVDELEVDDVGIGNVGFGDLESSFGGATNSMVGYIQTAEDKIIDSLTMMIEKLQEFYNLSQSFGTTMQLSYAGTNGYTQSTNILDSSSPEKGTSRSNVEDKGGTNGDTYNFYSPKVLDEVEAAQQLRKAKKDLADGF